MNVYNIELLQGGMAGKLYVLVYIYMNVYEIELIQGGMAGKQTNSCPIEEKELAAANEGQGPCSRRAEFCGMRGERITSLNK